MKKIAHEAPKAIFNHVETMTDYSYCLVHLLEEDEEYLKLFEDMRDQGREVILDNSLFELETPFNADRFFYWVERMKPTWYIIPDKLEDCDFTVKSVKDWQSKYVTHSKSIGVVQGKTYEEVVKCYNQIVDLVDMVAISFDYSFFHETDAAYSTKYHYFAAGRQKMLQQLLADNVIDTNKPHHLLGCSLPQEFIQYRDYDWIYSIDTSNPIVAGIKYIKYNDNGLEDKPSEKLFTLINATVTSTQLSYIEHNIAGFRRFVNG